MSITQVLSLVQFTRGTSLVWAALTAPIPAGVATFSIDDGVFKLGDGVNTYSNLPTLFTFDELVAAQGGTSSLFSTPTLAQNGKIVVISFDAPSGKIMYSISTTSLSDLLASLTTLEVTGTNQSAAIAQILSTALSIDASINTGVNGNIVTIRNGRYSDSGTSVASMQAQIAAGVVFKPGSHILDPIWYSDISMTMSANNQALMDYNTYYINIPAFNNTTPTPVVGLTSTNPNIIITKLSTGTSNTIFSVMLNNVCTDVLDRIPVSLVASCDDGTGNATVKKVFPALVLRNRMLECVYGGTGDDRFQAVAVDSNNNIICAGYTNSEGAGSYDALAVKFDNSLNILVRKVYGGSAIEQFNGVAIDASGNIFCVGITQSGGAGGNDCLIIKFDNNLNILLQKSYRYTNNEQFNAVAVDSSNNIIAVGYTSSEGVGGTAPEDALVVKFDNNLNILARYDYGGDNSDKFNAVAVDPSGNIICAGYSDSTGFGYSDALVVKFDNNLNILAHKSYGGTSFEQFTGVVADSSGNIFCVGYTSSDLQQSTWHCLIIKFSSTLSIIARKYDSASVSGYFYGVDIDSNNNIIAVGYTFEGPVGAGGNCRVTKFDNSLNIITCKVYGGANGIDQFNGVAIDSSNNIICAGYTNSTGSGSYDGLVLKLPTTMPVGTFVGTVLTGLSIADSTTMSLADSALTLGSGNLTLTASNLPFVTLSLALSNSSLIQTKDTLN